MSSSLIVAERAAPEPGASPLVPLIGSQVLRVTAWRGVFVVLAAIGAVLLLATAAGLGETLPPERRQRGSLRATLVTVRGLLGDRFFVGYALSCGLAFAAMFTYISGSPFVLHEIYGVSPQLFSVLFGQNALGLMVASQINGRLVGRLVDAGRHAELRAALRGRPWSALRGRIPCTPPTAVTHVWADAGQVLV